MSDQPRKAGVYDNAGQTSSVTGARSGGNTTWWIVGLVVLLLVLALLFLL